MILPSSTVEITTIGEREIGNRIQGETVEGLDRLDLITYSRRNRADNAIIHYAKAESSKVSYLHFLMS